MLSRIAESLFWIGRYAERAEATARLLQVQLRLALEDPWQSEAEQTASLLALMGLGQATAPEASAPATTSAELVALLAYDETQPSSIVSCWRAIRSNARRAREVIPSELWECINTTWHHLPSGRFKARQPNRFFDWARERSALFSGIARGSMVRDDGWSFLVLGRSLELTDMSSRIVASAALSGGPPAWPAVLRGCGAYDAFLRTYRGFHADREAAEFMITDDRFPRSIMHGLQVAHDALQRLVPGSGTTHHANADHAGHAALHLLGQQTARLRYTGLADILGNLNEEMDRVQHTCREATMIITATYFASASDAPWREGVA